MAVLVGVDGCRGGWLALIDLGHKDIRAWVFRSFLELLDAVPKSALIGVGIPIGLPEKGPRPCDLEARRRLGKPRSNSVFSALLRACLVAKSHEEAGRIRFKIEAKKMILQAFGILPKIREVDELLVALYRILLNNYKRGSAVDKQAQTLSMPVTARRQLNEFSDDLWTKINTEFYRNALDAVFKSLVDLSARRRNGRTRAA